MFTMRRIYKSSFKILFIIGLIIGSLYTGKIDFSSFIAVLANIKLSFCFLIILIFMINFHLVALRNYLSYKQFNIKISYNASKQGLLSGQLGGILPIFGSVISQSIVLKKSSNISSTTSAFMYFYDKIIMASSGLAISLICSYFLLLDRLHLKQLFSNINDTSLIEFFLALATCLIMAFFYAIPIEDRRTFAKTLNLRTLYYLTLGMLLSVCIWILSAFCFLICLRILGGNTLPELSYIKLFYASAIVSFIASMPVTVNGWGVREFAAIKIFSLFLIPREVALGSAVVVGVFSTISLLVIGLFLNIRTTKLTGENVESAAE